MEYVNHVLGCREEQKGEEMEVCLHSLVCIKDGKFFSITQCH